MFGLFQELDKAPRTSVDLVVKVEDFLDEKKDAEDILPVSKDEVTKLVEAWRVFKTEIRLA
jgi:hypothetical protein